MKVRLRHRKRRRLLAALVDVTPDPKPDEAGTEPVDELEESARAAERFALLRSLPMIERAER